jgi:RNA polymerase sigma factor (sigma-70 family)
MKRSCDDPGDAETATRLLVERACRGDAAAWGAIVDRYTGLVWWIARQHRLSADDAADVVQTTWLRCVEHLATLRDRDRLGPWLVTTCRRESLRTLSRLERSVPQDCTDARSALAAAVAADADPCEHVARQDEAALVRAALAALPPRQRAVLAALMDEVDGTYQQAARRLGVPVGSLGPTRRRALERLRLDERLKVV